MKKAPNQKILAIYFAIYVSLSAILTAQTTRPEPGSATIPAETIPNAPQSGEQIENAEDTDEEDKKAPPKGNLRIWLGGTNNNQRFAVGIIKSGQKIPESGEESIQGFEWLYRGLRTGSVREYVEVPVGNYDLVILPEEVEKFTGAGEEFQAPKWKKVKKIERESLRILAGSHKTAVVRVLNDDLKVDVFDDAKENNGSKILRVFNLTGATIGGLKTLADGKELVIFRRLPEFYEAFNVPHKSFEVSLELHIPGSKTKYFVRKFYEADFRGSGSCSLVVFLDRYGRTTSLVVKDGTS